MEKGNLIAIIIVASALVVVAGGGLLLYSQTWNPSWNPFIGPQESWDKIFPEVQKNIETLNSYHADGDFSVRITGLGKDSGVEYLRFSLGNYSDVSIKDKATQGDLVLVFKGGDKDKQSQEFSMDVNFLTIFQKDFYFKINKVDFPKTGNVETSLVGSIADKFKNEWVDINADELKQFIPSSTVATSSSSEMNSYKNLFTDKNFFSFKKELGTKKINGKIAYGYLVTLRRDKIMKVFENANALSEMNGMGMEGEIQEANKFFTSILDAIGDLDLEIWIGAKDKLPYRVSLEKEVNFDKILKVIKEEGLPVSGADEEASNMKLEAKFNVNLSKFNEEFNIKAPKESKSFYKDFIPAIISELMKEIMGSSTSTSSFSTQGSLVPGVEYSAQGTTTGSSQ